MTKYILKLITGYQRLASPILKQLFGIGAFCRYPQNCSSYAKQAIEEKGILSGGVLAAKRILSCQPFSKIKYEYI